MSFVKKITLTVLCVTAFNLSYALKVYSFTTVAKQAVLIDADTGSVLFEKNADDLMSPASMTKMMTAFLVFDQLKKNQIGLNDKLPVSEKAWRMGGSKMFVELGNMISVEDLLRGIIIQSGNDACVVIAEGLGGSESAFADKMTKMARKIGMKKSIFKNSSGWPEEGHRVTARELAILGLETIRQFPELYKYYAEINYIYHDIKQWNRNPLLGRVDGVDGLKTGHTEEAGYGLTASAVRGDRRLVLVVNGLESENDRSEQSHALLEYGFREFENYKLFKKGNIVSEALVWLGDKKHVGLVSADTKDIVVTLPRGDWEMVNVKVKYKGPIPAPIKKGDYLADLIINVGDKENVKLPLFAAEDIKQLGFFGRKWKAFFNSILEEIKTIELKNLKYKQSYAQ